MKNFLPVTLLALSSLLFGCNVKDAGTQSPLWPITLATVDHQQFSLRDLSKHKASVIIFLQPECPFCNSYGKILRQLDSAFTQKDIPLIGVVAGKNYPNDEINEYMQKHQLTFHMLLDPDFVLKNQLHASKTPQAFLIDANGNVVYHGMIDNWGYEIGKVRPQVTEHYLTDAMDAYLQNKPIATDSTKAIGCYIE